MLDESKYNEFELSIMSLHDHALIMNEYKNIGIDTVPVDIYLELLGLMINYVRDICNVVNEYDDKMLSQEEQLNSLLDYIKKKQNN
ncbi:hypothetical protein CIL05_07685 [Virgibacillus profundi]|uniref:Uncharacterized protein n=1 Tax=Virgibacillus profundi TaxID=2024555 RepID=A0A2A2IGX7_9BACI|nr:hypothetical protein [Virgibacillus profundi]PAV30343.1 hypothetical protein CIL05_07685 [Virgibacillus profundi]PXY54515.1 hypothetical protein CIT14_07770 [Virgibacillus profundi]